MIWSQWNRHLFWFWCVSPAHHISGSTTDQGFLSDLCGSGISYLWIMLIEMQKRKKYIPKHIFWLENSISHRFIIFLCMKGKEEISNHTQLRVYLWNCSMSGILENSYFLDIEETLFLCRDVMCHVVDSGHHNRNLFHKSIVAPSGYTGKLAVPFVGTCCRKSTRSSLRWMRLSNRET